MAVHPVNNLSLKAVGDSSAPRRWRGMFMAAFEDTLNFGQFVIDRNHTVAKWDAGLERITGIAAAQVVGTRYQWKPFYGTERPVLADFLLDDDFPGALAHYGKRNVWKLEHTGEWIAIGQCLDRNGTAHAIIVRASWNPDRSAVVETVFLLEQIADWARVTSDRFDGMRVLAEHVPAGVCMFQDFRIIFANQTFCTMFGYSHPEEVIDLPPGSLLVEEQRSQHMRILGSLSKSSSNTAKFQWTGIDKQGRKIWFEGRPVPIEWNGRPAVLSFTMDITEFKQREELMERESRELQAEYLRLKSSMDYRMRLGNIIGKSQKMQEVYDSILKAAVSDSGIIIYGETGTGKELVAKAVHGMSRRNDSPFVPVNCGAVPEELFESEFFGYRKGAFTGAFADKVGILDKACGGTVFLDEVAELTLNCQVKLLRALGSGEYTAVGGADLKKTDIRIVAATNRNLEEQVRKGAFRQDFFYRIHIIPIHLPPLRERKEDIPFLVEHILNEMNAPQRIQSKDLTRLLEHDWPGNVRELRNVLERYVAFGNLDFFQVQRDSCPTPEGAGSFADSGDLLREKVMEFERQIILHSLRTHEGNKSRVAAALGLPRKTLFRMMKKLGID